VSSHALVRIHANWKLNETVRVLIVELNINTNFYITEDGQIVRHRRIRRHLRVQNPFSQRLSSRLGRPVNQEDLSVTSFVAIEYPKSKTLEIPSVAQRLT